MCVGGWVGGGSKGENARRRRASSHAGFGAVGMRGRSVAGAAASTHRIATASSLLKASETRAQRLQRLLAQLGQQRARVGAELEAQRNYLASINDDLTRGQRRDARQTVRTSTALDGHSYSNDRAQAYGYTVVT